MYTLITGVTSDIGISVCKSIDVDNLLICVRRFDDFKKIQSQIVNKNLVPLILDLEDTTLSNQLDEYLRLNELQVSNFIHVAGLLRVSKINSYTKDSIEQVMKVNLISAIEITSTLTKRFNKKYIKNIIFFSSLSSIHGVSGYSVYSSAKAGLNGLALSLQKEFKDIQFNSILLGPVKTKRTIEIFDSNPDLIEVKIETINNLINSLINGSFKNETLIELK